MDAVLHPSESRQGALGAKVGRLVRRAGAGQNKKELQTVFQKWGGGRQAQRRPLAQPCLQQQPVTSPPVAQAFLGPVIGQGGQGRACCLCAGALEHCSTAVSDQASRSARRSSDPGPLFLLIVIWR